jgi:hypothetical protein
MNTLSKTRFLMEFAAWTDDMGARFIADPDEVGQRQRSLTLTTDVWRDMGEPLAITVTIEPGDLLND